jgi:alpha-beta hydrolase superfamily lysophospholipase
MLIVVNAIAFMQAWSMTHYTSDVRRTNRPEALGIIDKLGVVLTGVKVPRAINRRTPRDVGLNYSTHLIKTARGERIAAWVIEPSEETWCRVLLFPPYAASRESLLAQAVVFHHLGCESWLIDFRGVGESSGDNTTLGVREATDVALLADYVGRLPERRPLILYGASMGAVAVMRAVASGSIHPDALILESPFDRLIHTIRHRFEAMNIPSWPAAELLLFWGAVQHGINSFGHNPVEYARAIDCPVLLIHGDADRRVSRQETEDVLKALAGPARFVPLQGVGHGSLAHEDPGPWFAAVEHFLAEVKPAQK